MGTALAVTQQQSSEAADRSWARIYNRDRCPRCSGLMVAERYQDLSDYRAQRCVQCGEIIDPVILLNRGDLQRPMTTQSAGKALPNDCMAGDRKRGGAGMFTASSAGVDTPLSTLTETGDDNTWDCRQ
jgi:hypothetical protein